MFLDVIQKFLKHFSKAGWPRPVITGSSAETRAHRLEGRGETRTLVIVDNGQSSRVIRIKERALFRYAIIKL